MSNPPSDIRRRAVLAALAGLAASIAAPSALFAASGSHPGGLKLRRGRGATQSGAEHDSLIEDDHIPGSAHDVGGVEEGGHEEGGHTGGMGGPGGSGGGGGHTGEEDHADGGHEDGSHEDGGHEDGGHEDGGHEDGGGGPPSNRGGRRYAGGRDPSQLKGPRSGHFDVESSIFRH